MPTKRSIHVLTTAIALALLATTPALARQRGGKCQNASNRMYDPATVEMACGVIARIDTVQARRGSSTGLHLQLKTADATLPVHLGPTWFFADQDVRLRSGDSLTVHGSRVTIRGATALIADDVRWSDHSLQLRDDTGLPLWRGQRRKNR